MVKLTEFLVRKSVVPALKSKDKRGAVAELVQAARKSFEGEKFNVASVVDAIMDRERTGSTGVGGGLAVPHAKLEGLKGLVGAFGRSAKGLDFDAVDGEPVHLVFLILAPPSRNEEYLQALRLVMVASKRPNFVRFLRSAKGAREIEEVFREVEEAATV
jgi:mannitol/fructose-specific phosphotransferase system IIA component (Ntr-type)